MVLGEVELLWCRVIDFGVSLLKKNADDRKRVGGTLTSIRSLGEREIQVDLETVPMSMNEGRALTSWRRGNPGAACMCIDIGHSLPIL